MKKRKSVCVLMAVAAVMLLMLLAVNVYAKEHDAQSDKVIKVGYFDVDQFIYPDSQGGYQGYGAEYLEWVSKETGWEYPP